MRILRGILTLFVAATLWASLGCGKSTTSPTAPSSVSFSGSRNTANSPAALPDQTRCGSLPSLLIQVNPGNGTSTLGAFVAKESVCLNPASAADSNLTGGLFSFDFGGGNTISGTTKGGVVLPPTQGVSVLSETFLITAGTSRYAGATGTLTATGQLLFNQDGTTNSTLTFTGTVTTP